MFPHTKPPAGTQINPLHPLSNGLVGCWLFNEGAGSLANDISGHGNNGTLKNGVAWSDGGVEVDGVDDYIDCGQVIVGYPFTLSALVFSEDIANGVFVSVAGNNAFYHTIFTEGGTDTVIVRSYDGTIRDYELPLDIRNDWYLITGVWESASSRKLYVDGVLKGESTTTESGIGYTSTKIGVSADSTPFGYFNGFIDSVNIWNRTKSAEEIAWLYREPYAMFEPSFNPALLYSAAPPVGAIINQFQKANIGADLYNGVFA